VSLKPPQWTDGQSVLLKDKGGVTDFWLIFNMEFIYMKQPLKMPAYEEIVQKTGVLDSAVAYIGDDLPDLPLMPRWARHRSGQCGSGG
jgi:hypothetical protein